MTTFLKKILPINLIRLKLYSTDFLFNSLKYNDLTGAS